MTCTAGLNVLGFLLTVAGVLILYFNSPRNISGIDGGNASTDSSSLVKDAKGKNQLMVAGVVITILGSLLQLISSLILC
jgi:hypothetical protein